MWPGFSERSSVLCFRLHQRSHINSAKNAPLAKNPNTHAAFSKADPELVAASTIEAIRKKAPIISMVQKFTLFTLSFPNVSYAMVQYTHRVRRLRRKALQLTNSKKYSP